MMQGSVRSRRSAYVFSSMSIFVILMEAACRTRRRSRFSTGGLPRLIRVKFRKTSGRNARVNLMAIVVHLQLTRLFFFISLERNEYLAMPILESALARREGC